MNREAGIIIALILAVMAVAAVYGVLSGTVDESQSSIGDMYDQWNSEDTSEDTGYNPRVENPGPRKVSERCKGCGKEKLSLL